MCPGPLDEMHFWQARFEVLGSLKTQLDTLHARNMVALLKTFCADRNLLISFQSQFGELSRVQRLSLCLGHPLTTRTGH